MIKKFEDFTKDTELSDEDMLFEMANLLPKRTGLKYTVWYSAKVERHKPRIKVDLGDNRSITIQIESHLTRGDLDKIGQKDLDDILRWLDLNKEILLKYWYEAHNGTIDNGDVMDNIVKV